MGGMKHPEVWLQATGYEAALMNTAIETENNKILRDLYTLADKYRDPQALILAYDNAHRIGGVIAEHGDDPYQKSIAGALEAGAIIKKLLKTKNAVNRI